MLTNWSYRFRQQKGWRVRLKIKPRYEPRKPRYEQQEAPVWAASPTGTNGRNHMSCETPFVQVVGSPGRKSPVGSPWTGSETPWYEWWEAPGMSGETPWYECQEAYEWRDAPCTSGGKPPVWLKDTDITYCSCHAQILWNIVCLKRFSNINVLPMIELVLVVCFCWLVWVIFHSQSIPGEKRK